MKTRRQRSGFTIIEVLVVIGLMMMAIGLTVANFDRIALALDSKPVHRVFRAVVAEARYQATHRNEPLRLRWNAERQRFTLHTSTYKPPAEDADFVVEIAFDDDAEERPSAEPLDEERLEELQRKIDATEDTQVLFFPLYSNERADRVDTLRYAEKPIPEILIEPDGTATPARIIIRNPGQDDTIITLDAFSSGPLDMREDG